MDFGIMFFASTEPSLEGGRYQLLQEVARLADDHGFSSLWTPERHFHRFGGLFPNPAVVSAALAVLTQRVQLRAGSLVSPLHDSVRIAEDWAVVDNLSNGRVGISFGCGWNLDDFIFFPERYAERQAVMYRQIDEVRTLWRGGALSRPTSTGQSFAVEIQPRPVQAELPVWVTSSGHPDTFTAAGRVGANLLTHLIGQDVEQLAGKISLYRQARAAAGHEPASGIVTLMLHTFVGHDLATVEAQVRQPMREYLRSAISLEQMASESGGAISGGHRIAAHEIPPAMVEELLDLTFRRYFATASLLGTPASLKPRLWRLTEIGVDEIACLIDFHPDAAAVLASLEVLAGLVRELSTERLEQAAAGSLASFLDDLE